VLYIVHFTAFCLGGRFFPVTVYTRCTIRDDKGINVKVSF